VKKAILIGCLGALVLGMLGFGGLIFWFATGPEGGVRLANEIEPYAVEYMEQHGLLEPGEQVLAYYDDTLSLNGERASIVTDRRVMVHADGETFAVALDEIEDIHPTSEALLGEVILVETESGVPLKIEIAPLNQGESFVLVLQGAWNRARNDGE
jgi:hypothetical protein